MKFMLVLSTLLAKALLLSAAESGVTYVDHEKVTAALAKGGPLVTAQDLTDVIYVVEGEAAFVTGGTMIGGKVTKAGQSLGTDIKGGDSHHLGKGDVIVVPAGVPHWFKEVPRPVSYYVVKVLKP